jgi:hypothetical protein
MDASTKCSHCARTAADGHKLCSECITDRKRYWVNNRERLQTVRRDEYQGLSTEQRLLKAARSRAIQKNLPFEIDLSDICVPEFCPVLGVRLERSKDKANPNSPSLDKIDPKLGYVKGNVWVISNRANTMKHDATLEELERLVAALRSLRRGCEQ